MYADDSTMYRPWSTLRKLNDTLNIELKAVADWVAKKNRVLNICERIQTYARQESLTENYWTKHIENIVTKIGRSIAIIRKCSQYIY